MNQTATLRIATRSSHLALSQAEWVAAQLVRYGVRCKLVTVTTQGDRNLAPFRSLDGEGFFTKAVQGALLDGRADIAVHSLKDLPSAIAPGLSIAAVPQREDSRDVLLASLNVLDESRPLGVEAGTVIGTSAVRRQAQVATIDPALKVKELRGNVPNRVEKLRLGNYGAIIVAAAGLNRLHLELHDLHVQHLDPQFFVPAPGQGALALEVRADDVATFDLLRPLESPEARLLVSAERGLMARLSGGCQLALGASATRTPQGFELLAWYGGCVFKSTGVDVEQVVNQAVDQIRAEHGNAVLL